MEEKGTVKISLTGFFLILAIIAIVVMGFFMYQFYTDKQKANEKVETLNSEVTKLQSTINSIQSTINNSSNTSNEQKQTTNSETDASDSEIKQSTQNYIDLICAEAGSMRSFLKKLGLINGNENFDARATENDVSYTKTDIKYTTFKSKMLEYVTENWFEKNFTDLYKNINGYLCFIDGGASGAKIEIKNITKNADGSYTATADRIFELWEKDYEGYEKRENISIQFRMSKYNNKWVVDYCSLTHLG